VLFSSPSKFLSLIPFLAALRLFIDEGFLFQVLHSFGHRPHRVRQKSYQYSFRLDDPQIMASAEKFSESNYYPATSKSNSLKMSDEKLPADLPHNEVSTDQSEERKIKGLKVSLEE
jgi:hypothetical protein